MVGTRIRHSEWAESAATARAISFPRSFSACALAIFVVLFAPLAFAPNAIAAEPLDVVFVLDNSGSMRKHDPEYLTRSIVLDFADALSEDPLVDGRIAIVLFDGKARLAQGLTPIGAVPPADRLRQSLAALDFSGQRTNSPAAVERAIYELRQNGREGARRAIVFLTDGKIDTGDLENDREVGRWLRDDLASEGRAAGIRIFGVAFTESADYSLMQALARRTGARYYRAFAIDELSDVVDDVLARVTDETFYQLASADAGPPRVGAEPAQQPRALSKADDLPAVAAGPEADSNRGIGLLALIPAALLLVAAGLFWQSRNRKQLAPRSAAGLSLSPDVLEAPTAQLLDFGGQVGETGTAITLQRGRTRVGRDPHNEISLDDETISSEHARIELKNGLYWLEDLRSTNGTRLGERRLEPGESVPLKGGDHIRFADIDLMFILAGYLPGGATVVLNSTTSPPPEWRADSAYDGSSANRKSGQTVPPERVVFAPTEDALETDGVELDEVLADLPDPDATDHSLREPAADQAPEGPGEADEPTAPYLSLIPTPPEQPAPSAEAETRKFVVPDLPEPPTEREPTDLPAQQDETDQLRGCLDYHLERVRDLSPAFAEFIARAFDEELRAAMAVKAGDLLAQAEGSGQIAVKDYSLNRIRYVLCGLPGDMQESRDRFVEAYGGYTRLLSNELGSEAFRANACEVLAVLSFGRDEVPWCSLSIVPDEGQDTCIDLLSYEFLTHEERLAIVPANEETDISQSGLR